MVSKTAGLLVVKVAPSMTELVGVSGCFAFFAVCVLLSVTIAYFLMPETKGLSLIELENLYRPAQEKVQRASTDPDDEFSKDVSLQFEMRDSRRSSIVTLT